MVAFSLSLSNLRPLHWFIAVEFISSVHFKFWLLNKDTLNILNLYWTSTPSAYSGELYFPLLFSDCNFISVSCPLAPIHPHASPTLNRISVYNNATVLSFTSLQKPGEVIWWFIWNDHCFQGQDPSVCAVRKGAPLRGRHSTPFLSHAKRTDPVALVSVL